MKDNFRGALAGLAIGDALGMPFEGISFDEIREKHGVVKEFMPSDDGLSAGEWTDDTEQALILAESLCETLYFSPDNFAEKLKKIQLSHRYGPTSTRAITNLKRGYSWRESGIESDTDGSSMRVSPIGLLYHYNYSLVENYAAIASSITHKGNAAIAGSVAVAVAIACILNEDDMLFEEVVKRVEKYDTLTAEKIEYAYQIRNASLSKAVKELGNTIMAFDAVPMAFYCYFSSKNFEQAVIKGASAGGDTDTIAAMAGSMKGAETGFEKIPAKFKKIKDLDRILEISDLLYEAYLKISKIS